MSDFTRTRAALAEYDIRQQAVSGAWSDLWATIEETYRLAAWRDEAAKAFRDAYALDTGDPRNASASIDEIRAAIKERP